MTEGISPFPHAEQFAFNRQSDETYVAQIAGEVPMEAYVKAQASAPQVDKRVTWRKLR